MRALTGAIITAAALLSLGLVAIGIGERYQNYAKFREYSPTTATPEGQPAPSNEPLPPPPRVGFGDLDQTLKFAVLLPALCTLIGLGITFFGLAYHHHRRHHEFLHHHGQTPAAAPAAAFGARPPVT